MSAENLIIFYTGILLMLSIEQIFTIPCETTKGDCVADDKRGEEICKKTCFRNPTICNLLVGTDLFGKDQKYQCHCNHLSDCENQIFSKCENGCLLGYKEPYCQTRKYHEFIKNEGNKYSYLFSSDNKKEVKPPIRIQFRNTYRFNTVEIHSHYTDSTMKVTYPSGIECKLRPSARRLICTGDATADKLYIDGIAEVYHIKLIGCPQELYGKDCINKCHCSRGESCDQISGICKNGCEDGWRGEKCDNQTYVNIAQGKQTYQTSTLEWDKVIALPNGKCVKNKMWMSSGKAVDGNFDHVFEHMSCTHTTSEQDPYWEVTLDKPYMISQLRIYNRMTHYFRLSGFKVYLGSSLCFESTKDEYKKQVIYIKCQKPVYTSNVKISLEGKKKALTLCEVEVIQCVPGFYGDMCMERCELCVGSKCDQVTGHCEEGCITGYVWDNNSKRCKEKSKLKILIVAGILVALLMGMAAGIWCWVKRPVAKGGDRIREVSIKRYSEAITDYREIPLNENQSIYIPMASSSLKLNLLTYVAQKKQEVEPFIKEFLRLPKPLSLAYNEGMKPENAKKNQCKTILPYDHSRVKLRPDEISSSDYINANFICGQRYIACQGATQSTVTDFWRMIWQLKCNIIVLLEDMNAAGKTECMQYWPDEENTETFGTIQVEHIGTSCHSTYIHRRFFISKTVYQDESWIINHFFFKKWPDHNIPPHAEYVLEFRNALKIREELSYPLVVHCCDGVGRTGAYICIDILLNEMVSDQDVDVLACIKKLRKDRMHMVQKRVQLEFIYDVLVENIFTGDYDVDVSDISEEFARLKETDNSTRVSILEHQFQAMIKPVKPHNMKISLKEEEELANFNINGVFIDGPSCEKEFLVTETPVESKTVNFLRFVSENSYLNIVAFFNSNRDPPNYLPKTLNGSVKIGPYLLQVISLEDKDICVHSVLKIKFHNKRKSRIEEYLMNHFLVTIWRDKNYPACVDILELSDILSTHQEKQVNKKFTVHSGFNYLPDQFSLTLSVELFFSPHFKENYNTNFNKSGLLCIIHILKDAITSQSVINIVRLVRLIKKIQPEIVPDCESYAYIWEVAEYLQKESSLYSNFTQ